MIAKRLTDYVINKGMIKKEERQMYEYGFTIAFEMGLGLLICFGIAGLLHMIWEAILFWVIFIPLRSYAGGLHLKRYSACLFLSCLTFSGILLLVRFVEVSVYISFAILVLLQFFVFLLYPVENVNREVDWEEDAFFKKRLRQFLIVDGLIGMICVGLGRDRDLMLITATFAMVVVTMILGKYKKG